jgi:hypothetical protein
MTNEELDDINVGVFWNVSHCSLVGRHQRFGETSFLRVEEYAFALQMETSGSYEKLVHLQGRGLSPIITP